MGEIWYLVLTVTIWPVRIINMKISPVFADIFWIPRKIRAPWNLLRPPEVPRGKWPNQRASRISCGFRIMEIGPVVSKISSGYILVPLGDLCWAQGVPGAHILHNFQSSSNKPRKQVPREFRHKTLILQNTQNPWFWPNSGVKKGLKVWPLGVQILHTFMNSPS